MGQQVISKDGQTVVIPWERATGRQLREVCGIPADRHLVVAQDGQSRAVRDDETVEVTDGMHVSDAPRYRYGSAPAVAARLEAECHYIAQRYRQDVDFGFDADFGQWWVYLPEFVLPRGWREQSTPILVTVPAQYPSSPPDGFFLSNELRDVRGRRPAHYFEERSAHNPLTTRGWAWFCIHVDVWAPSYDIRDGDSVAKYLTLIHLVMGQAVASA